LQTGYFVYTFARGQSCFAVNTVTGGAVAHCTAQLYTTHQCYFSYGFSVSVTVVIFQLQLQLFFFSFYFYFS